MDVGQPRSVVHILQAGGGLLVMAGLAGCAAAPVRVKDVLDSAAVVVILQKFHL